MSDFVKRLKMSKTLAAALLGGCLIAVPQSFAQDAQERTTLNLNDAEITDLIEDVSIVTGYTFIVHPQVRGRVTVTSQEPLTRDEVFDVFLSTLRVHQAVAIPSGDNTYSIVPEQTASSNAALLSQQRNGDTFVTQVMKLNYFDAVDAAQMLKPMVNPAGQVVANKNSNTVVVVDYASNMTRLSQIVRRLDEDQTNIETVSLENVPAREMEGILNALSDEYALNFTAIAAESSNAIVLRGDDVGVARALDVTRKLDETERARDNIRVIPLSNAKAIEIVPVLERLGGALTEQTDLTNTRIPPTISAHEQTNSLVISADYDMLSAMERVVASLDVRRPQVMVEALVVDISDDAIDELGLQFILSGTDGNIPFVSTNYSRAAPNILALTGALVSEGGLTGSGDNPFRDAAVSSLQGLNGLTLGVGGVSGDTLFGFVLNAVQNDTQSNILSTPMIMAVDNEESSIIVGQEIPVITGEAAGANLENSFRTIERQDVGIQLDITPQIGDEDSIKLQIYQEASDVVADTEDLGFVTNKRSISNTVIADDGELIVLGGLVQQTQIRRDSKVPILGDLPGVGPLFRSRGNESARRNLMVFIRPSIVRDSEDARLTTSQKYRYLRAQDLMGTGADTSLIDSFVEEVMGATPPAR